MSANKNIISYNEDKWLNSFPHENESYNNRINFKRIIEQIPSKDSIGTLHDKSIAVHLHIFYFDLLPEIVSYLNNIHYSFDLFVSIPNHLNCDVTSIKTTLQKIEYVDKIIIERTINRGRDLSPMLCVFKKDIIKYDILLHIHTKKSPQTHSLIGWREFIYNHLLRNADNVTYILQLLSTDFGIVAPPDFIFCYDATGWTQNIEFAQQIINRSHITINLKEELPSIKFPQGSMFWCKTDYLKELFAIEWHYDDFPAEPLQTDGTLAHALERLFFVWNQNPSLKCCFLYNSKDELTARYRAEYDMYLFLKYANHLKGITNNQENVIHQQNNSIQNLSSYIKDIEKELTKQETNINEITKELEKQKQDNCILKSKIKNVYGENSNLLKQISKQKKAISLLTLILGGFALVLFYISFSFYR